MQCWVVCARPLLTTTVVCMCIIWKALCPYVLDVQQGLWVSLEHTCTCAPTTNQAERRSSAAYPLAGYRSTRGLQPGGDVHKEAVHLLFLQLASITSSGTFKPECNGLSQFREDTGGPSMPVQEFNLIACSWQPADEHDVNYCSWDITSCVALLDEPCGWENIGKWNEYKKHTAKTNYNMVLHSRRIWTKVTKKHTTKANYDIYFAVLHYTCEASLCDLWVLLCLISILIIKIVIIIFLALFLDIVFFIIVISVTMMSVTEFSAV